MKRSFFWGAILFLLAAGAAAEETNSYSIFEFTEKCEYLEAEISYPVFADADLSGLNKEIETRIFGGFGDDDLLSGYEKFKQEALETYEEICSWDEADLWYGSSCVYKLNIKPAEDGIFIDDDLVSAAIEWWEYTGGAHGNYWLQTYVFDRKLGRLVTAPEVTGLTQNEIRDMCRRELREQLEQYLVGDDGTFYKNWLMDGTEPSEEYNPFSSFIYDWHTLRLFFAPYMVAPYSAGLLTVEIPVEK